MIQTKGGESRDMSKRDLYKKPFLITVSKLRRQKWETKPKKRDNVEVGGIESSREMLWNKQKARLNGGTRKERSSSPGLRWSAPSIAASSTTAEVRQQRQQLTPLSSCPYDFHSKLLLSSHLLLSYSCLKREARGPQAKNKPHLPEPHTSIVKSFLLLESPELKSPFVKKNFSFIDNSVPHVLS